MAKPSVGFNIVFGSEFHLHTDKAVPSTMYVLSRMSTLTAPKER